MQVVPQYPPGSGENTNYVLHCFEKDSQDERRDTNTAEQRWKQVQQRLREEQKNE